MKKARFTPGSFALFGSAPLLVRRLREASHDIDIIMKPAAWEEYRSNPEWTEQTNEKMDSCLEWEGHNIELWKTWGPGAWEVERLIDEAEIIDGLPYVRLETVLAWKKRSGRPKDLIDVELIEAYLASAQA